jgi:hypothetical protein
VSAFLHFFATYVGIQYLLSPQKLIFRQGLFLWSYLRLGETLLQLQSKSPRANRQWHHIIQLEASPIHLTNATMTTDDMHRFSPAGVEVEGNQNIFQDIMENSASFFDSISMSDSTTANHFAKIVPHETDVNPTSTIPTSPKAEETRDASPTITKKANDVSTHIIHECERQDASPLISTKSIKMETRDNKGTEDCGYDEMGGRLGALPRHENGDKETLVQSRFQFDYSKISLLDTNSEEIEGTGEEQSMGLDMLIYDDADLVKTDDGHQPVPVRNLSFRADKIDPSWCAECSSKPFFLSNEMQEVDNELREPPTDAVYKERLEQIAAQRSTIANIAIKFEDLVMSICCGHEDEVLFVLESNEDEHTVHTGTEEEETKSLDETPTDELAGLLSTVRISTVGKLSARDAAIVPLYEKAVLDLVTIEHQIMRKSRSIELGKKVLASCTHLDDKMKAATTLAFLEVEIKECRRKVVTCRESVKCLYEAFSIKTQKVIDRLQTEGYSLSTL